MFLISFQVYSLPMIRRHTESMTAAPEHPGRREFVKKPILLVLTTVILSGCGDVSGPAEPAASILDAEFTGSVMGPRRLCAVSVSWTECPDAAFSHYVLYRSAQESIPDHFFSAETLLVAGDQGQTVFTDLTADWNTRCYYVLRTENVRGDAAWSNEEEVAIPGPLPPGMDFAVIPEGSFQMGSPPDDPDSYDNERPVHTVTFDCSFEMMTTEVTQAMWTELMTYDPSGFQGDENPVEKVTWDKCQDFIAAMNDLDTTYTYRLPSEAEWEYACRAGTGTRFYWGDDPDFTLAELYAWFSQNSGDETHPAGQKLPNAWGLYDMSGNVWEWCQDTWHNSYEGAPSDGSAWEDGGDSRVIRGGAWIMNARQCRSPHREHINTANRYNWLGFRLVRTIR